MGFEVIYAQLLENEYLSKKVYCLGKNKSIFRDCYAVFLLFTLHS